MIANKVTFSKGVGLLASFTFVFVLIFTPIFNGQNGLEYLDDLYNSISKGSAYYIPKLQDEVTPLVGKTVSLNLKMDNSVQAEQIAVLLNKSGATTQVSNSTVKVDGDLGNILNLCLNDSDLMYANNGKEVKEAYGFDERLVLYNWWAASKLMDKELKKQKLFKEAKVVTTVQKKGLETSYNYYKIKPEKISSKWGIVMFSLIFYVIYTLWYGFAIMFMFEGWGLRLEEH
ncbi:MAG: hypothetical protein GY699_06335 [Desulfobacteraceae bacterium]|nr:hypothetical protein [Desulfobacteraceae bacterium]